MMQWVTHFFISFTFFWRKDARFHEILDFCTMNSALFELAKQDKAISNLS